MDGVCVPGGSCGVIGAGGNVGAVVAALLNRQVPSQQHCITVIGVAVILLAVCALGVRFSVEKKAGERALFDEALQQRALA